MSNGCPIPPFPEFSEISLEQREFLQNALQKSADGISEFTFSNLYLFRRRYNYKVSIIEKGENNEKSLILSGEREGKKFFMTPLAEPPRDILKELFTTHDYWKNIGASIAGEDGSALAERANLVLSEDRDNFDYLYLRKDLAELTGKKYHKKRNLVNAFLLSYPEHSSKAFSAAEVKDAKFILEYWQENKRGEGDFIASNESLELFNELGLSGRMVYINSRPAAYCLGEAVAGGTSFAMHFEKAIEDYKGIYQFINQDFALSLSEDFIYINREQDLGDEGLRQAKMTYRPCGFVKKWTAVPK